MIRQIRLLAAALMSVCAACLQAQSVYTQRPDDKLAVYLTREDFGARGDGRQDDSDALQRAIDRVQETTRRGIVFIPEGRYRLTKTVHVWSGIRLIGYGARRPVFVLAPKTAGFQQGSDRYMLWFTDERPAPGTAIGDASEFTFWSAASNIDFEIGDGNPAAVAVRFNVAQHSFVAHSNFHLGTARAAIEAVGNQAYDLHIHGGQYAIITGKTSPAWQFLLMDSSLTGQSVAGISTHEAGFTLVRDQFSNMPIAIEIPQGQIEQLYGRELQFQNISQAVLKAGDVANLHSEIAFDHLSFAHVVRFVSGIESLPGSSSIADKSPFFSEDHFSLGLDIGADGREQGVVLHHTEHQLGREQAALASDVPALPPMAEWVNVTTFGVKGDGATDDTAALQRAIDSRSTLYLPSGVYRLTGSLHLRPDTRLIGMSPATTQLTLNDATAEFAGSGPPMPLLLAPHNGSTIVTGIGIATGNANPRAAGIEWLAGPHSLLDDVEFIRGRGRTEGLLTPGSARPPAVMPMQLDAQYASLWIHDGGGGIFRGLWSHAGTAHEGLLVENTETPGTIYQFSCEHHMRLEAAFHHVANWKIFDLQTEEENPEGATAYALDLTGSRDLLFANTYMYRVSRNVRPMPYAVLSRGSDNVIFQNVWTFSQTRLAFDNSFFDPEKKVEVRAHSFTSFTASANLQAGRNLPVPAVFAPGAALTRLASGFSNASGLTADAKGQIFFSDAVEHTIYRWNAAQARAEIVTKIDASPMVLGFVKPATLVAINNEKSVSAIDIASGSVTPVAETAERRPGTTLLLPAGFHNELWTLNAMLEHRGYVFRQGSNTARRSGLIEEHRGYFYAPGSNLAVLAGGTWRPLLQSSQLVPFQVGEQHLIVSEDEARTYKATLVEPEKLVAKPFIERGGTAVVTDQNGNIYVAGDQLYIYDSSGYPLGVVEIPERPSSLVFGGSEHRTLFIGARSSLYSIVTASPGQ